MTNDKCKQVYDAAHTLPEDGAISAIAAFVDKFGATTVLTMLATVCVSMEQTYQEQAQAKPQGNNVVAFPVPGSDKLN